VNETTHTDIEAVQLLRLARGVISHPDQWTKRRYGCDGGPHCAAGAVMYAYRVSGTPERVRTRAWELLEDGLRDGIENWNDADERSHSDVLERFDAAIARGEAVSDEQQLTTGEQK
jgi:hypothetical protein